MVGAARRLEALRAAEPFAVVVEEASEVMEPTLMIVDLLTIRATRARRSGSWRHRGRAATLCTPLNTLLKFRSPRPVTRYTVFNLITKLQTYREITQTVHVCTPRATQLTGGNRHAVGLVGSMASACTQSVQLGTFCTDSIVGVTRRSFLQRTWEERRGCTGGTVSRALCTELQHIVLGVIGL